MRTNKMCYFTMGKTFWNCVSMSSYPREGMR